MFVDAGFVYVEPNVRGSDGYGQAWLDSDNGAKRLKVWTDIEDAADRAGVPTELIIFADGGHGAGKRENRVLKIGHALRFMETQLKGGK